MTPQNQNKSQQTDKAYSRENEIISYYKDFVQQNGLTKMDYVAAMDEMCSHYEQLLTDTKLLTSVGDRLQRKLKGANALLQQQSEEILKFNDQLKEKNIQLKLTIDELTRARASRKARAYTVVAAVLIFIASELIENQIEDNAQWWVTWGIKFALFAILKPVESYLESYFVKASMRQDQRERLENSLQEGSTQADAPVPAPAAEDGPPVRARRPRPAIPAEE